MDVDPTWRGQDVGGRCLTGSALAGKIQPFGIQVSHSAPCSVLIGSLNPGDWRLNCSPTGQEPGWPCLSEAQDTSSHQTCSKVGTQKGQGTAPLPLRQWFISLREFHHRVPKCTVVVCVLTTAHITLQARSSPAKLETTSRGIDTAKSLLS